MPPRLRAVPPADVSALIPSSTKSLLQIRHFTQSQCLHRTRRRREMAQWLATIGYPNFGKPLAGSTNYISAYSRDGTLNRSPNHTPNRRPESEKLMAAAPVPAESADEANARRDTEERLTKAGEEMGAENRIPPERMQDLRPFKQNVNFYSQPVLGEDLREAIYEMVVEQGKSVRATSAWFNVTMERVAAVVRMKTMERDWVKQGKPLATAYSTAILSMLPKTRHNHAEGRTHHEPINDLPILAATKSQLFYPVSESRAFTREDAGKAFLSRTPKQRELLPADKRIPHPEMIVLEKASGLGFLEKERLKEDLERDEKDRLARAKEARREREMTGVTVVSKRRADFKFTDVSVEQVGRDGRNRRGVGWRYGMPHEDRKPGQIKIPTSV